jgi:outer membrane protein assembly factor BamB
METGAVSRVRIGLVALAGLLAACTSGGSAPAGSPRPSALSSTSASAGTSARPPAPVLASSWPTYHGDTARSGFLRGAPLTLPLRRGWERRLDGAVYAQPIVVGAFVLAATENNSVYALRADNGAVVWRRHLAAPVRRSELACGNIDPLGITGTPAYDVQSDDVFVVTETTGGRHDLHAIDARNGRVQWTRNLDVVDRDRNAEQQRSALLVTHHKVYVAFGGLFGDCGNYIGYVTAVGTDGRGPVDHYALPSGREAGIWAPPGPVEDPTGALLIAVGNGSETGGRFDGSDSVVRLSPGLRPLGVFAPSTWAADNSADLDLGSSSPVQVGDYVVIAGKRGTAYLLAPGLGGIGHQLATLEGCAAYGGAATVGTAAVLPCSDGLRRLDVDGSHMRWAWRLPGVAGSPLVVGDTVYALSQDSGDLYAVDLRTGRVRGRVQVGAVTRFATPAPTGSGLVVGTTTGILAVRGK